MGIVQRFTMLRTEPNRAMLNPCGAAHGGHQMDRIHAPLLLKGRRVHGPGADISPFSYYGSIAKSMAAPSSDNAMLPHHRAGNPRGSIKEVERYERYQLSRHNAIPPFPYRYSGPLAGAHAGHGHGLLLPHEELEGQASIRRPARRWMVSILWREGRSGRPRRSPDAWWIGQGEEPGLLLPYLQSHRG